MHITLLRVNIDNMNTKFYISAFLMFVIVISICCFDNRNSFAHPRSNELPENISQNTEDQQIKHLQKLAEIAINMLIATRNVITKNQELINNDPVSGNYYFKGFVPAVVGSEVANDFSLMTGYKLKQTSLKIRNPSNAPDEWERKILESYKLKERQKANSFGEIQEAGGRKIYRYLKPLFIEKPCLACHGAKEKIRPEIRDFLEKRYPNDKALGYKEGELRGGISIIIPMEDLDLE